jgi:hypothetical protein
VAALGVTATCAFAGPSTLSVSVSGPSHSRVDFTRPGGIPGSARSLASTNEQYLLAPAQPSDPAAPKKRKKH